MMDRELRILSGLHRGALLPLTLGFRLTVGSDPGCDIVLVDPGVKPIELSVQLSPEGWQIERFDAKGKPTALQCLPWGQPEIAGGVVLTVVATTEEWIFVSADELERVQLATDAKAKAMTPEQQTSSSPPSWVQEVDPTPPKSRRKLTQRLVISAALVLGFATFSISRAVSTSEETRSDTKMLLGENSKDSKNSNEKLAAVNLPSKGSANAMKDAISPLSTATETSSTEPNPEKLRAMLVQRLRDAYLVDKLDINLTETEWSLRGLLDEEEAQRFNRILSAFYKEHNVKIPLKANLNSTEEMLPFKIQQFNGGAMASVVTDDGQRLYIGDSHMGFTLQRVEGSRIIFAGKRKVEVLW